MGNAELTHVGHQNSTLTAFTKTDGQTERVNQEIDNTSDCS